MTCKLTECVNTQYKQQKVEGCLCVRLCNPSFRVYVTHCNINSTINWCIQWAILLMFNDKIKTGPVSVTICHLTQPQSVTHRTAHNTAICMIYQHHHTVTDLKTVWHKMKYWDNFTPQNDGMTLTTSHAILYTIFGWQCNMQGVWPPRFPNLNLCDWFLFVGYERTESAVTIIALQVICRRALTL